jgi:hypothetical protein
MFIIGVRMQVRVKGKPPYVIGPGTDLHSFLHSGQGVKINVFTHVYCWGSESGGRPPSDLLDIDSD